MLRAGFRQAQDRLWGTRGFWLNPQFQHPVHSPLPGNGRLRSEVSQVPKSEAPGAPGNIGKTEVVPTCSSTKWRRGLTGSRSVEEGEGLFDACREGVRVGSKRGMDFKNGGGRGGQGFQDCDRGWPVNGAIAGPQVLVLGGVIVVDVEGGDAAAECGNGRIDADGDVSVAEIETDADVVQVAEFEDGPQAFRGGGLAEEVFDEQADTEGMGEGAEVLEGSDGVFDGTLGPPVVALAEVQDKVGKGDELGGFQGALDLVHGVDAAGFLRVQKVDGGCAGATHFAVGEKRGVHGKRLESIGTKPGAEFGDVLAAGVVEVLPGGINFDRLGTGAFGEFQQAGVQALVEEQVRGKNSQHGKGISRIRQAHGETGRYSDCLIIA